jgi:hypothetical protein
MQLSSLSGYIEIYINSQCKTENINNNKNAVKGLERFCSFYKDPPSNAVIPSKVEKNRKAVYSIYFTHREPGLWYHALGPSMQLSPVINLEVRKGFFY